MEIHQVVSLSIGTSSLVFSVHSTDFPFFINQNREDCAILFSSLENGKRRIAGMGQRFMPSLIFDDYV